MLLEAIWGETPQYSKNNTYTWNIRLAWTICENALAFGGNDVDLAKSESGVLELIWGETYQYSKNTICIRNIRLA